MTIELANLIDELTVRLNILRASQEDAAHIDDLSERDILLLELLNGRGTMTVSEVAAAYPNVSESTISTNITKLWRDKKLVSKQVNPDNQRVTFVEITEKGKELMQAVRQMRGERFAALLRAMGLTDEEREVVERVTARTISHFDEYISRRIS